MEQIKAHIAVSLDGHTATPDYELDWMPREVKELAAREHAAASCLREVKEEVTIDVVAEQLTLIDCQRTVEFEIFSHLRHRYAPGVTRNTESWFCLALPHERQIVFTEHLAYKWLDASAAAALTKSWSNRQAIEQFVINAA